MSNSKSTIDSILKKSASFSKEIDNLKNLSNEITVEQAKLSKKGFEMEEGLFALAKSLHEFQQETISTTTDLYDRVQSQTDKVEKAEAKVIATKQASEQSMINHGDEIDLELHAIQKDENPVSNNKTVKIVKKKKEEPKVVKKAPVENKSNDSKTPSKEAKGDEEVYLFDL